MTAGFYTHYSPRCACLVHWAWLGLLRLPQASKPAVDHTPGLVVGQTVAIVVLYLPWLPNLLDLVQHVEQLNVGGDIGWEDPVTLFSVPADDLAVPDPGRR